jgi:hypothetical protein
MLPLLIPNYKIPHVKDCIKYIESCGWEFQYYNIGWYVFKRINGRKFASQSEVTFTLKEIRNAFKYGW